MEKKMFRNCPYSDTNLSCIQCEKYEMCRRRKRMLREKRRKKRLKRWLISRTMFLALIVFCIFTCKNIFANVFENKETECETTFVEVTTTPEPEYTSARSIEVASKKENLNESTEDTEIAEATEKIAVEEPKEAETQISAYGESPAYYYNISEEDKFLITKVVYAEARGECLEGKVAVAAVVLNRYFSGSGEFNTSSIEAVITQSGAFASISWVTESMLAEVPECREAVEAACKGWDPTRKVFEDGAKFFYAYKSDIISPFERERRKGIEELIIGEHAFHNEFNEVELG